jgi:hypothetical protein
MTASAIDFSMIDDRQVVNLCLQRSNRLKKIIPNRAKAGDAWAERMGRAARKHRDEIFSLVFQELSDVFETIVPSLDDVAPRSVADIGCGQAFIDLLIHRRLGCSLTLIDIETSDDLHFGFAEEGAGYADLGSARAFLVANGVPDSAIRTINPRHGSLAEAGRVDLAVSLISCGFHYPVSTYDDFFRTQVDRAILLDCRNGKGGEAELAAYGSVTTIGTEKRHTRYLCRKP